MRRRRNRKLSSMVQNGPMSAWWRARKTTTARLVTMLLPSPVVVPLRLEQPLRVGYLRFDRRVGEVLLQTPLFRAHKPARPSDKVIAIVHPKMVRVLEGQPGIDEVVPFTWRGYPASAESRALLSRLKAVQVDVAVDCSDPSLFSVGHALATRMTGAPVRIGFNRGPAAEHFTHPVDVPEPLHEATARARLLRPLGIEAPPLLQLVPRPHAPVVVEGGDIEVLMRSEPGHHVVVCPGGRLAWRRGGPHHFGAMCRAAMEAGRTPWLAPGPGEEALCASVVAEAPGARVLPVTNLDELGGLMHAAGATLCNNSGPMHLSVAVGAATFALFVVMDPVRWGHHAPQHRMVVIDLDDTEAPARLGRAVAEWLSSLEGGVS